MKKNKTTRIELPDNMVEVLAMTYDYGWVVAVFTGFEWVEAWGETPVGEVKFWVDLEEIENELS